MTDNIHDFSGAAMDNESSPVYTIGIAAQLTNTSVHALRVYEDKGLILPYKTDTNRRLYSRQDIQRINCIRHHLDEEGLNIAGIKALLALVPCWLIRPCSEVDHATCDAYTSTTEPCWAASEKGAECRDADCRQCRVYQLGVRCGNIKELYKQVYGSEE